MDRSHGGKSVELQSMLGQMVEGLGPIEFLVLEEDAEVAKELLKTLKSEQ
jgi:hypothetical protein